MDTPVLERLADLSPQNRDTPHWKILINNHADPNRGKIKGYFYLEVFFGVCKRFQKLTKFLGFHLMFKTANFQDFIYTSMDDDMTVTIDNLYLYIPNSIPSVETQLLFNEATQYNYETPYDQWYTERRVIKGMIDQHDIGSAQKVNSSKYLIRAHQTKDRIETPNNRTNIAILDNVDIRESFAEIDGQRYPRDIPAMDYELNDYTEQYQNLKVYFKEFIGEPILNPLIS